MAEIVTVSGGEVRGSSAGGVTRFLGIPYAAAPVGPARFEAPRPVAAWSGVRDALEFGPTCVQSPYPPPIHALLGSDGIPGDEYLNVNVWAPENAGTGLPVMVWIHGGAFTRGANARTIYDGTAFARDGVVLVSINYRLGISGFANIPGSASNRGLRDQIFALEWVRDNIAAFGGDPGNVTVFGESAGGMSVVALLASPRARGLFRRAIAQSANGSAVATAEDAGKVATQLADLLGIEATTAAFGALGADELRSAQDALALELLADPDPDRWGASIITNGLGLMSFFPMIDGDIVPDRPVDVLAAAPDRTVPLLTGWTAEEFRFFTFPSGLAAAITEQTLAPLLARYGLDPAVADRYAANRPQAGPADVFAAVLTDHVFRDDAMRIAEASAAAGNPAFVYEFAWRSGIPDLGACHVVEIPFVFDRLDAAHALLGATPPQRLADEVHRAWVRFATHGDPGWSRFDTATRTVRVFDSPESHEVADPRADELRALRRAKLTSDATV
ncbi:carboxylesterase/lipase family protein [Nocardia heshunensis]